MIRVEVIPRAAGTDIRQRQQGAPEKRPQRGSEDFKLVFDEAVEQIKNQSEIVQPPGLFKDYINPEAVKSQWTVGAKAVF